MSGQNYNQPNIDPNQAANAAEKANQMVNSLVNGAADFGASSSQFGVFGRGAFEYNSSRQNESNHSGWNPQNPNPSERRHENHTPNSNTSGNTGLNGPSVKDSVSSAIKVSDGNGTKGSITDGNGAPEGMTIGVNGTWNRMAPTDATGVGRAVLDTVKSSYAETDAAIGAKKVGKAIALTGITSMGSPFAKTSVSSALYNKESDKVTTIL